MLWLGIGSGMVFLLVAAIEQRNKVRLRSYTITITGGPAGNFLTQAQVEDLLHQHTAGVRGELVSQFNMRTVESRLQQQVWIRHAKLYFDNQDVLHVKVQEKLPLARIFTTHNRSFYLDELGMPMPLSTQKTMKLPVFTGLPDSIGIQGRDSAILQEMRETAQLIAADSFWASQVAQIDRTPDGEWELIPVVGDHIVKLGSLENLDLKFRRLWIFYSQVLAKTGLSHYRIVDVRFEGQVVAGRGTNPRIDSLQLRRSVQQLLQQSRMDENDTLVRYLPQPLQPLLPDLADTAKGIQQSLPIDTTSLPNKSLKKN